MHLVKEVTRQRGGLRLADVLMLLHAEGRKRDFAMFNLAIDSKLRGCDLVRLRVDNVAPHAEETCREEKLRSRIIFAL